MRRSLPRYPLETVADDLATITEVGRTREGDPERDGLN